MHWDRDVKSWEEEFAEYHERQLEESNMSSLMRPVKALRRYWEKITVRPFQSESNPLKRKFKFFINKTFSHKGKKYYVIDMEENFSFGLIWLEEHSSENFATIIPIQTWKDNPSITKVYLSVEKEYYFSSYKYVDELKII